jgi:stringent starvation protein B
MLSRKPYFLRAMHQWIMESGCTPYIVVDAHAEGVEIPPGYAQDGKIVLNVSYAATQNLEISNEQLSFAARFGGVSRGLRIPMVAVLAVYAQETGQGMLFDADEDASEAPTEEPTKPGEGSGVKRPQLKVIK